MPSHAQRLRRPRPRAADRRPAPVHLLRLDLADRAAGRHGPAAQRRGGGSAHLRAVPSRGTYTRAHPRIVIAAGGTAGHVVPAIAVADALRAEGAEVTFVGGERAEAELVPQAGYELDPLNVEGLSRSNPLKAARALAKAGAAVGPARKLLKPARPTPCSAVGATSPDPSGSRRRCPRRRSCSPRPTAPRAHEPRARATGRAASASHSRSRAGRDRYRLPAGPSRPDHRPWPRPRAARIDADETCVLVFGGSLGARSLNIAAPEAFKDAPYRVVHVAGTRDYPELTSARAALRAARLPGAIRDRARRGRRRRRAAPAARSSSSRSTACRAC